MTKTQTPQAIRDFAAKKAAALVADRDSAQLIVDYLYTQTQTISPELATARGWISDELERRGDLGLLAVALDRCPECWAQDHQGVCA